MYVPVVNPTGRGTETNMRGNRQTSSDDDAGNYLETVEGTFETEMGIVETWHTRMAGEQNVNMG